MLITRRTFLRGATAAGLVSCSGMPPAFLCRAGLADQSSGQARDGRILVVLQLEGGNDGLNTVIPYADDEYYKARPGIGVARDNVLKLNDHLGLHPQLAGFQELYDDGMLGILQGIGYPQMDRSHFRSMDIWQSADLKTTTPDRGWIGRALDLHADGSGADAPALALGLERLPLALTAANVNVPMIADMDGFRLRVADNADGQTRKRLMGRLAEPDGEAHAELSFLRRATTTAYQTAERMGAVLSDYLPAATYPGTPLAERLKLIAQMISAELGPRIFYVSLGGFDTHSQQIGAHQALLGELAGAVRAFFLDLKGHGLHERVALVTFSEFGRRVKENGSLGTDHGAASQMFFVTPGRCGIHGAHPSLTDLDDGDLKFHTDFRSVYATLLEKWLGLPSEPILGGEFTVLDFV